MDELDLTNAHLPSLQEVDLPPSLKVLDLTANRLRSLEGKLLVLTGLRRLCLRQNLLTAASEVEQLASASVLEELELRDNQFQEVPNLAAFTQLRMLEVSYNEIRSMAPLSSLAATQLSELYCASNKVGRMEGISQLTGLQVLELGSNRIRSIENLDTLAALRELWLGRNRICEIANLGSLTALRRLSLQSNRLVSMRGVEGCTALEELYLSHNGIQKLEGLESLRILKILDVSNNRITRIEGLEALVQLTDLWLNDNQIESLEEVEAALKLQAPSLTCLYLKSNPCAQTPSYALRMRHLLPQLQQLDDNLGADEKIGGGRSWQESLQGHRDCALAVCMERGRAREAPEHMCTEARNTTADVRSNPGCRRSAPARRRGGPAGRAALTGQPCRHTVGSTKSAALAEKQCLLSIMRTGMVAAGFQATVGRPWLIAGARSSHTNLLCSAGRRQPPSQIKPNHALSCSSTQRLRCWGCSEIPEPSHVTCASGGAASPTEEPGQSLGASIVEFLSQNYIPVGLLSAIAFGWMFPALGVAAAAAQMQVAATVGIFIISGLVLQQGEMVAALRAPLALGYGLAAILVITPMLSTLLLRLPLQPPEMALGLAVYCCMPTSLSTNIALSQACNGNAAVSLLLTVASNLLSVATVPLALGFVLGGGGGVAAAAAGGAAGGLQGFSAAALFRSLMQTVLAPLLLGVAMQSFAPGVKAWRTANKRPLSYLSTFFLCLVPWMQVSKAASAKLPLTPAALAAAAVAGAGLHLALLAFSLATARVLRFSSDAAQDAAIRKAVVLATAQKTLPIAVGVLSHLGASLGPAVGFAVIPCVMAHLLQTVIDSMLVARWNQRDAVAAAAT